ncbi:MAG: hypothetical protein M4579_000079 [Chaenotheca gracillima]|nr:MAG: hypothetical protein M4579_000079 [Chaenotheca gracillima]
MPSDQAHAKFLYTILKQLDLKSIDWSVVASQLEITNGHAARMRFSRFKQHMEGVTPCPRRRNGSTAAPSSGSGAGSLSRSRKTSVKAEKAAGASTGSGVGKKRAALDKIKSNGSPSPAPTPPPMSTTTSAPSLIKAEPMEEDQVDIKPDLSTLMSGTEEEEQKPIFLASSEHEPSHQQPFVDPNLARRTPSPTLDSRSMSVVAPPAITGPTRKDFGPFAGVYPPPGTPVEAPVSTPTQTPQVIVKDEDAPEQMSRALVKREPRWDDSK